MSLVSPYNKKAIPNVSEDKYIRAWNIIEAEVERLLNLGWKMDLKGKANDALMNYKAANYYIYLFHYAMNIDAYITRGKIDRTCMSEEVFCAFKIDCVQKNLPCISNDLGADYLKVWKALAAEFDINITDVCPTPSRLGEWEFCAFETPAFTLSTGTDDTNCIPPVPGCSTLKQITP
tara:strand:- start:5779 stop:6309 length:531 start_codon:yes stop_codon:yes gene_type:complete